MILNKCSDMLRQYLPTNLYKTIIVRFISNFEKNYENGQYRQANIDKQRAIALLDEDSNNIYNNITKYVLAFLNILSIKSTKG